MSLEKFTYDPEKVGKMRSKREIEDRLHATLSMKDQFIENLLDGVVEAPEEVKEIVTEMVQDKVNEMIMSLELQAYILAWVLRDGNFSDIYPDINRDGQSYAFPISVKYNKQIS